MMGERLKTVAVIGFDEELCPGPRAKDLAREVGRLLAEKGFAVMVGGGRGIMRAAVGGAKAAGGVTVSFAAGEEDASGSGLCLPTGMGWGGHSLTLIRAADGVIAVGGGSGTLLELCLAYLHRKPMVALNGAGGWSERLAAMGMDYMDERRWQRLVFADEPAQAVAELARLMEP